MKQCLVLSHTLCLPLFLLSACQHTKQTSGLYGNGIVSPRWNKRLLLSWWPITIHSHGCNALFCIWDGWKGLGVTVTDSQQPWRIEILVLCIRASVLPWKESESRSVPLSLSGAVLSLKISLTTSFGAFLWLKYCVFYKFGSHNFLSESMK